MIPRSFPTVIVVLPLTDNNAVDAAAGTRQQTLPAPTETL